MRYLNDNRDLSEIMRSKAKKYRARKHPATSTAWQLEQYAIRAEALETEIDALREFAQHKPSCPLMPQQTRGTHTLVECACGFDALLTGGDDGKV